MYRNLFAKVIVTLIVLVAASPSRAGSLGRVSGLVQMQGVGFGPWRAVSQVPRTLSAGEKIRTGPGAGATLLFADGSRLELEGDSSLVLEVVTAERRLLRLVLGSAVLDERGARTRLITPTVVATVREGGAFRVGVLAGGRTEFQVFSGLLGVEDNRGQQALLRPRESLRVDIRGMAAVRRLPSGSQMRKSAGADALRREMAYDAKRAARLGAAAAQARRGELELGRALIDRNGERVRSESYLLRPSPNQVKYISLTGRGPAIDYFYYHGTFSGALPDNLASVWAQLSGAADSPQSRFLTGYDSGMSNGVDSLRIVADGGHLVDLNANADATDNVETVFDAASDSFRDASGRPVFVPLFDRYGVYLNGKLKYGETGTNIQAESERTPSSAADPFSGAALTAENAYLDGTGFLASRNQNTSFPDAASIRQTVREDYSDGAFLQTDNFVLNGDAGTASTGDFGAPTSGTAFRTRLLNFNLQHVVSASEFGGRKIDLFVAPRVMVLTGLIR